MRPELKFCGLTRVEDVSMAIALGARYVGVIRATSPRQVTEAQAGCLLRHAGGGDRGVLVLGETKPLAAAEAAAMAGAGAVQLHADPTPELVEAVRGRFAGEVWAAVRIDGDRVPDTLEPLFSVADSVVLDARPRAGAQLGGSGVPFDWDGVLRRVQEARRGGARLVLAGGLRSENVADAVRALSPDVVDVSSGVERAPGVKDHDLMRAFTQALWGEERVDEWGR